MRNLLFTALLAALPATASAQLAGEPFIHDPSTIIESNGRYYTWGTGPGSLVSDDGWTWKQGAKRPGGGLAPDVIQIGDRYYLAYAASGGGLNGGHAGKINIAWSKSLDPKSPDHKWHEVGTVASSTGLENNDAIDPAFLLADGRLWLSYGTYFGTIRIVELDPKTGQRLAGNQPVDIAIDMEATALLHRNGWYYLLGTHGTCCDGPNSSYNIRVGRSRSPTGPYVDHVGIPLLKGGGKLVIAGRGRQYGPGHFGLIDVGQEIQKFSMHYESDLDRSGRSILSIAPLLWQDDWPVAGENLRAGTYEIQSERSGGALQLTTDFIRMPFDVRRSFMGPPDGKVAPIANQSFAEGSVGWPTGTIDVDLGDYMIRAHQQWAITPVVEAGGVMGTPYYKIVIAGTDRALTATRDDTVKAAPAYSGAAEQLWRIDQLIDGTYRISPKSSEKRRVPLALSAIGASTPVLQPYNGSTNFRWRFMTP
ncbi:family 43 glycosylhydrolase [Sphingomonas piscis]|uniref:Family 43 glycosylhydrolase n=1 Tax=Sphingomonas piscis TaxID=2714943 RepID=A0A6G7YS73_9SPHN|nr:family 43 glycosylhydrolase [Sphingomonas piscis]QIK79595.1 family 43 glycosylhydrolase [Sphingomonas piscis]